MKTWLSLALLAWTSTACVTVDHHGSGDSTLTVDWSIDGDSDPAVCDDNDVRYAEVTVEDHAGYTNTFTEDCDRFGVDIDVPAGRYWVSVVLLDNGEHAVTSEVDTDSIVLGDNDSDSVHVDFGNDSFF
jgi:hypothetical protein